MAWSYSGAFGDLVVATGSVDQTGTYVFEVPASPAWQTLSKDSPFWTTADGSDTMFTLWNSGSSAEDLIATFTWNGMAGQYRLPVHLDAGASLVIDMAQLIAANKPDGDGKVIPPDVREGSAMFAGTGGMRQAINLVVSTGEYDVETATCCVGWLCCYGVSSFNVSPGFPNCPAQGTCQLQATETMSDNSQQDVTNSATWSGDDTTVATVSAGLVTGVAAGTVDIKATVDNQEVGGPECGYFPACNFQTYSSTAHPTEQANLNISMTAADPTTIHSQSGATTATITVQIFHQAVSASQNVTLDAGTNSSTPANISATYTPASQTVTIPQSGQGTVSTTLTVSGASVPGGTSPATLVVAATLTGLSAGLKDTDPGTPGSAQKATLTVITP
ncbi:MAG TPA: Ig-like domain-containing protein [Candidatus Acidoferrales bacterium]|nr:Ig-like domain-containing protein [Candidatus Acidoferrales bacterium]